ncbi:YfcE family phosphodiesterase [Archaeoglobales archaeon]|nr:MAG: YfcE family phosphodiesterase [Archaeoglobales archaeon]
MASVLIMGDTHIPRRASRIPRKLEEVFIGKKFDYLIFTGDLTGESVLNYIKNLADRVVVVRGNMDHLNLPEYAELKIGDLRIGVIHGDQVYPRGNREQLEEIGIEKGVDVLVSGHTHSPDFFQGKVLLVNPGSATGVWGGGGGSLRPSLMICNIAEGEMNFELFELEKSVIKRRKFRV